MDKENALKWVVSILVTLFKIAIIPVGFMVALAMVLISPILFFIELVRREKYSYDERESEINTKET